MPLNERRFPIRYSRVLGPLAAVFGAGPAGSAVTVEEQTVRVRMGHAFAADIDRGAIRTACHDTDPVRGWGVHGRAGRWLVNGSSKSIVRITIDPPATARLLRMPVTLRVLRVSVTEPDALLAELGVPGER
jgi:hypothetical protein